MSPPPLQAQKQDGLARQTTNLDSAKAGGLFRQGGAIANPAVANDFKAIKQVQSGDAGSFGIQRPSQVLSPHHLIFPVANGSRWLQGSGPVRSIDAVGHCHLGCGIVQWPAIRRFESITTCGNRLC